MQRHKAQVKTLKEIKKLVMQHDAKMQAKDKSSEKKILKKVMKDVKSSKSMKKVVKKLAKGMKGKLLLHSYSGKIGCTAYFVQVNRFFCKYFLIYVS